MVDKGTTCSSFDATTFAFHAYLKLHPLCWSFTHRSRQGYPLRGGSLHSISNPHSEPKGMTASCALRQESLGQGTRRSRPQSRFVPQVMPSVSSKSCSFRAQPSSRRAKKLRSSTGCSRIYQSYLSDTKSITGKSKWVLRCFLPIHCFTAHALVRLPWRFHAIPS
jgi:hypothetical protein